MKGRTTRVVLALVACTFAAAGCAKTERAAAGREMADQEVENLVRRSYQYVAMYNVNNKFALGQGGWNTVVADTRLKDHTLRDIAIYIAAEQPPGVPAENWLPIERSDLPIDAIMRLYVPDLERFETWPVPKAEQL